MQACRSGQTRMRPIAGFVALVFAAAGFTQPLSAQITEPTDGMVCTSGPNFDLTTRTGYVSLPDSNTVYMWGFSAGSNPFQHPGPVLCVNQGDIVRVNLVNTLSQDVSITFPGQENVTVDGEPAQPQFDGTGALTSLTNVAPKNGGTVTYEFVANRPGTFVYQSGTNPAIQARMGLFGVLVVRPLAGEHYVYNDSTASDKSEFNTGVTGMNAGEFLVLQSEIDPLLNTAVELGQPFNMANYHPRYWLINGRAFPDTTASNSAIWLPNQPYGALAHIQPNHATNPLPYLQRVVNVSSQPLSFYPFGKKALVIGQDGQPARGPGGSDLSYERFALAVAPGQTYDALFRFENREGYDQISNPVPVTEPSLLNLSVGMFYSGSPYLGDTSRLPVGIGSLNQCGEYYFMAHNLALFKTTAWGMPLGGAVTFLRVDPPIPNNCPVR